MQGEQKNMTALLCPPGVWELLRETLELDSCSSAFDPELRKQIKAALGRVQSTETNHPMFAFRVSSLVVKTREAMHWAVGRLTLIDGLLVCVVPLPDGEYEICVRSDQARAIEEAVRLAGHPTQTPPEPAPDAHLDRDYEDRVSGNQAD